LTAVQPFVYTIHWK